ncbi:Importin subunit beta-3 (Importin beta sal3), partial [Durusdinium trenchii]
AETFLHELSARDLVFGLLTIVQQHGDPGVRHASLVVLGATLCSSQGGHEAGAYFELSQELEKSQVRAALVACIANEREWPIQRILCQLAGELAAQVDLTADWPELRETVFRMVFSGQDPDLLAALTVLKPAALGLLSGLDEPQLRQVAARLGVALSSAPSSASARLHVAVLEAVGAAGSVLFGPDRAVLASLSPGILDCVKAHANASVGELVLVLGALVDLCDVTPRLFSKVLSDLCQTLLVLVDATQAGSEVRSLAIEGFATLCERLPRTMASQACGAPAEPCVPLFVKALFRAMINSVEEIPTDDPWWWSNTDDSGMDEPTVDAAAEALGRLAEKDCIGPVEMIPSVMGLASECLDQAGSWEARFAGFEAVARIVEALVAEERGASASAAAARGAASADVFDMQGHIAQVCTWFCTAITQEAHPQVRLASLNGLGTLCTQFKARIQRYHHQQVLGALGVALGDAFPRIQARAADVLAVVMDKLPSGLIAAQMESLLSELLQGIVGGRAAVRESFVVVVTSFTHLDQVQAGIVKAIFDKFHEPLASILRLGDHGSLSLRFQAVLCLASLARWMQDPAVLPKVLALVVQQLEAFMSKEQDSLDTDGTLVETWGELSLSMGPAFAQYLPQLLEHLLRVIVRSREGAEYGQLAAHTSQVDDKLRAWSLVRKLLGTMRAQMVPFVPRICDTARAQVLSDATGAGADAMLRAAAVSVYPEAVAVFSREFPSSSQSRAPLGELVDRSLTTLLVALEREQDVEAEQSIIEVLREVISEGLEEPVASASTTTMPRVGHLSSDQLDGVATGLIARFKQSIQRRELARAALRLEKGTSENAGAGDADLDSDFLIKEELEESLRLVIIETLGQIAKLYADRFSGTFARVMEPVVMDLAYPYRLVQDRYQALFILDDVISNCTGLGADTVQSIAQILKSNIEAVHSNDNTTDSHEEIASLLQTALYAVGNLVTHYPDAFGNPDKMVEVLRRALMDPPSGVVDNALGAIGKLATRCSPRIAFQHREQALQVWLAALPLQHDEEEGRTAMALLLALFQEEEHAQTGSLLQPHHHPQAIRALAIALSDAMRFLPADTEERTASLLDQFRTQKPEEWDRVWSSLEEATRENLLMLGF